MIKLSVTWDVIASNSSRPPTSSPSSSPPLLPCSPSPPPSTMPSPSPRPSARLRDYDSGARPSPLSRDDCGGCWSDYSAAPPPFLYFRSPLRKLLETTLIHIFLPPPPTHTHDHHWNSGKGEMHQRQKNKLVQGPHTRARWPVGEARLTVGLPIEP
jgi:hypothetical protein